MARGTRQRFSDDVIDEMEMSLSTMKSRLHDFGTED